MSFEIFKDYAKTERSSISKLPPTLKLNLKNVNEEKKEAIPNETPNNKKSVLPEIIGKQQQYDGFKI